MNQYLSQPLVFLVEVVFGVYVTLVLLRFLFQLTRVDFYNPISQLIAKATNPPLAVLRYVVPATGRVDVACLILALATQYLLFIVVALIVGASFAPVALLVLCVAELVSHGLNIFIFAILILAVLSWVAPYTRHPVAQVLEQLTAPVLAPARRMLPPMSGIDFSPMLCMFALFFLKLLLIPPLRDLARHMTF